MATDVITNLAGSLDAELEKARETLRSVDDDIKKVFGKDASELTVFGRNRRGGPSEGNSNKEDLLHYNNDHFSQGGVGGRRRRDEDFDRDGDEPNEKRRRGGGEETRFGGGGGGFGGRLGPMATGGGGQRFGGRRDSLEGGGNNGDFAQYAQVSRRLASTVVSSGLNKSRDEVLAEQRQDRSGRERNRRMFGALLGTLQRFKQDETKLKDKEDKRAQIEAKLDEAAKHEREEVKTKKQELIKERKIKITEIKRIEVKRNRIAELEQWEEKTKFLTNFIRTEAKPHIFYLPKIMNPIMECRLEQSKQCVTEMISHKRKLVLEDLEDYEQRSKRYWEGRVAGRSTGRRIDPMDADMEDELHEIMKSDDIPLDEGEDFTVTVFTEETEDVKDSSLAAPIKTESNGIKMDPNSSDDEGKGKENIEEPMDDEEHNNSPKVELAADGSGDEDVAAEDEEITEETTIEEVKDEEETELDTMNTSDEVDADAVAPQAQEDDQDQEDEDSASPADQDEDEEAE